jgi:hypothetical protein
MPYLTRAWLQTTHDCQQGVQLAHDISAHQLANIDVKDLALQHICYNMTENSSAACVVRSAVSCVQITV